MGWAASARRMPGRVTDGTVSGTFSASANAYDMRYARTPDRCGPSRRQPGVQHVRRDAIQPRTHRTKLRVVVTTPRESDKA
jgi:hypothetical protein